MIVGSTMGQSLAVVPLMFPVSLHTLSTGMWTEEVNARAKKGYWYVHCLTHLRRIEDL